jgi:DNA-binding SARP family transcriptional activator
MIVARSASIHVRAVMTLSVHLLGPFLATLQPGCPLSLTSRKAQALLAYLAVEGARPHYREALSGLLWPERPDQVARGSLRQALQDLRRAIGDSTAPVPFLLVSRDIIQLNPEANYWLDVAAFEDLAAGSPHAPVSAETIPADALRAAVALCRGPFMDGFTLGDSPAFEEWLLLRREQFNRKVILAQSALAALHESTGAYGPALDAVWRIIELEPWQEEAHRQAMRLLALDGRRAEALAQYRHCQALMLRELDVEPGPETTALYERIRDGAWIEPPSPQVIPAAGGAASPAHPPSLDGKTSSLLVAREHELAILTGWLTQALEGQGRVALVTGEAGSGKTALLEEFGRRAMSAQRDLLVALGRCSALAGAGDAYQPFRECLRTLAGDPEVVPSSEHARRLRASLPLVLETLTQQGPDLVRLLAPDPAWLDRARAGAPRSAAWLARLEALVRPPDGPTAAGFGQAALCEQVARVLRAVAQRYPLLLLLDDLQFADAPSLDMLFHLGRHLRDSRILILAAFRPTDPDLFPATGQHPLARAADEFQRQWGDIHLDLGRIEGRCFVDAYLDSWPNRLESSFRRDLAQHTGGNALFTVELVQTMQERGDLLRDGQGYWIEGPGLAWEHLPPRVEGAIAQRVGQLTAAQRDLLQVASVEGEEFHADVLAHVLSLSPRAAIADLSGALGRQAHIVTPGALVDVGGRRLARYRFRHGMFQRYIYEHLDAATRVHLHGAVGAALEALYGQQTEQLAGRLARHYEAAGRARIAARYLLKAGDQAGRVAAFPESVACYERAIALLADLPADPERAELEFALQMALDNALLHLRGWGSPERLRVAERAYELGREMGHSTPAMLRSLRGMAELIAARGEHERALRLAGELLEAAARSRAPLYTASAHAILGVCLTARGELSRAWEHVSHALAFCQNPPHKLTVEESQVLRPHTEVAAAILLILRGYLHRGQRLIEALATGEGLAPQAAISVRSTAALLYAGCRHAHLSRKHAEEALRIIGDKHVPEFRAWSEVVLGWAEARAGHPSRGIARIDAAMSGQSTHSTLTFRFAQVALQVEACLAGGETARALKIVDETLAHIERTGARAFEPEMWRLRGECALDGSPLPDAEDCFRRAAELARQRSALLWELRATVSLARLWVRQSRANEARQAVRAVYGQFIEGYDMPDLTDAMALLDEIDEQDGGSG